MRRAVGLSGRSEPDWITRRERSNALAIRFMVWFARTMGRPAARLLLYPICAYFLLFSGKAREASRDYLARVLDRRPTVTDLFRHYFHFSSVILDRVFLLNGEFPRFDVRVHGDAQLREVAARGKGCFLLGAHLGSFEVVRSLGRDAQVARVSMVMYEENARKLNAALHAINPALSLDIIPLGRVDSMLKVRETLDRNEFAGMLADRLIEGEDTVRHRFLGEDAAFPTGPFRMAAILRRPIVLMFGLYRGGNRYDVFFERLPDGGVEESVARYAQRLEHYCRAAPYNWFNFYDFWKK